MGAEAEAEAEAQVEAEAEAGDYMRTDGSIDGSINPESITLGYERHTRVIRQAFFLCSDSEEVCTLPWDQASAH